MFRLFCGPGGHRSAVFSTESSETGPLTGDRDLTGPDRTGPRNNRNFYSSWTIRRIKKELLSKSYQKTENVETFQWTIDWICILIRNTMQN